MWGSGLPIGAHSLYLTAGWTAASWEARREPSRAPAQKATPHLWFQYHGSSPGSFCSSVLLLKGGEYERQSQGDLLGDHAPGQTPGTILFYAPTTPNSLAPLCWPMFWAAGNWPTAAGPAAQTNSSYPLLTQSKYSVPPYKVNIISILQGRKLR